MGLPIVHCRSPVLCGLIKNEGLSRWAQPVSFRRTDGPHRPTACHRGGARPAPRPPSWTPPPPSILPMMRRRHLGLACIKPSAVAPTQPASDHLYSLSLSRASCSSPSPSSLSDGLHRRIRPLLRQARQGNQIRRHWLLWLTRSLPSPCARLVRSCAMMLLFFCLPVIWGRRHPVRVI